MKIAVLGGGPGGYVAALKAAQLGAQVIVVESSEVGGTCLNWGCIPTKALLASAEALHKARNLSDYGIELNGSVTPNLSLIMERKNKVVSTQVKGIRALFKSWGVELIEGRGRLTGPASIEVEKKDGSTATIAADKIIIATGSRPAELPAFKFDGKNILSSNEALTITDIPKSMLIIGAGVIGCEFACIYNELGAEVTMIEMMPRAVSTEDEEISELLAKELKKKKIKLLTGVGVTKVEKMPDGMHAHLPDGKEIAAEKILVSIGRALNSDNIGLESVGINRGKRGEIIVDNRMETNIKGVYAVGDVIGRIMLAHVASTEGIVAAENICGRDTTMDYSVVPAAIFTSPEIGSVGLRENQATDKGIKTRIGRFQFRALGKAHAMGEISGFVKIIADAGTDKILGVHIIGPHASDLVHEAAVAMKAGLTARDIAATIHAHPTLSEGLLEASEDVHGNAVHVPKK